MALFDADRGDPPGAAESQSHQVNRSNTPVDVERALDRAALDGIGRALQRWLRWQGRGRRLRLLRRRRRAAGRQEQHKCMYAYRFCHGQLW
jgi:hypothetical protein